MSKPVTISFDGVYRIELRKDDNGVFSGALITKKEGGGDTPIFDFPVKQIQENKDIGLDLEFDSNNIFVNK